MRWLNWPILGGLVLSVAAFLSYFMLFSRWPATRDVPWVPYSLFAIAIVLLAAGVKRSRRKVLASIALVAGVVIAAFFTVAIRSSKAIPPATGAPAVGSTAPDFTLPDSDGRSVTLSALLAKPETKAVVLIFYRGYW